MINKSGSIDKDARTGGLANVTLVSEAKTSSHPSIKALNSQTVRYNRIMRKNAGSIGTPKRLQRALVLEQSVNRWRRVGGPLAQRGHNPLSGVA